MPYEELNLDLLAQHPAPFPDESLYGYILRLSEANGYSTPFAIFRLADIARHPTRAGSIRVEQLALITNRDTAELDRFSYAPRNCLRPTARFLMLRLLGHDVRCQDLRALHPSFCPDCVQEKGYVESHWDLAYMVACPVHHRPALSHCPGCKNPLSWFRRGLSVCKCGAILLDTPVAVPPQAELDLLDLLRRKVLRLDVVEYATLGTAASDLYRMDLRSILVLMRVLSKHYSSHITFDQSDDPSAVVRDAAQVLSDWPQNFYRLLNTIGESATQKFAGHSVRQQFRRIYRDLFLNWELHPEQAADFVRRAFLDFAMNHWGRGILTHPLTKGKENGLSKRFLNKTELARYLGVTPTTATRLVDLRVQLHDIADKVYLEDYANIIIFYVYLTKDRAFIEYLLANANRIYREQQPCDLATHVEFINRIGTENSRLELPSADVEKNREEMLRRKDAAEEESQSIEEKHPEAIKYEDSLPDIVKIHIALKNLRILGQIVRNFPGALRADLKVDLTFASYQLGLRTLRAILLVAEGNVEDIRSYIGRLIQEKRAVRDPEELGKEADKVLVSLTRDVAFGMIKRISQAVGLEELAETYREILERDDARLPVRMIDYAIKLDHFARFPKPELEGMVGRVERNPFALRLLRDLTADYLYLFPTDFRIRQYIGDRLGIMVNAPTILGSASKRIKALPPKAE